MARVGDLAHSAQPLLTSWCAQDVHVATVVEVLQSIKQSDMTPMLTRIYQSEGGTETLDVLMKFL